MLIINTECRLSSVHGTGLFTLENLHKGQIIWAMHPNLDSAIKKSEWDILPTAAKNYLATYMYWSERLQCYVTCLDNSRHMNHSKTPNTETIYFNSLDEVPQNMRESARMTMAQWQMINIIEGFVITSRDIDAHEEILCNYHLDFPDLGGAGTLDFLKD